MASNTHGDDTPALAVEDDQSGVTASDTRREDEASAATTAAAAAADDEEEVPAQVVAQWEREQEDMRRAIVEVDDFDNWDGSTLQGLKIVAGLDISFPVGDPNRAVVALSLLEFPTLKHLHTVAMEVTIDVPYKCYFLGFREVPHLARLYSIVVEKYPQWMPQVIVVDGNGILHPRGCGSASHFGVAVDCPTIGVAKQILIHSTEHDKGANHRTRADIREACSSPGDTAPVLGEDGKTVGMACNAGKKSKNPVFISVGHRISLATAVRVVQQCSVSRIPEPIRFADLDSRYLLTWKSGMSLVNDRRQIDYIRD